LGVSAKYASLEQAVEVIWGSTEA